MQLQLNRRRLLKGFGLGGFGAATYLWHRGSDAQAELPKLPEDNPLAINLK